MGPRGFFSRSAFDLFRMGWFEDPFGPPVPVGTSPESFISFIDNITFDPVPEPGTLALLAVSLVTLGMYRRRIV